MRVEGMAYAGTWQWGSRPSLLRRMERRSLLWRVQHWQGAALAPAPLGAPAAAAALPLGFDLHAFMAQRSLWQPRDTSDLLLLTLAAVTGLGLDILWLHFTQS